MDRSAKKVAKQLAKLLTADPTGLSKDENLYLLEDLHALISQASARRERVLAALGGPDDDGKQGVREEIGAALRWSYPYTQSRLAQAKQLVEKLPATLDLHETGVLAPEHVRALVEATYPLEDTVTAKVEARVLGRAPSQTSSEFKRSITRAVNSIDPRGAEQKHQAAKKTRGAWLRPQPDGMCALWSLHDAVDAEAIMNRLNLFADKKTPGDDRTTDQKRADALVDLVLGHPTDPTSEVKTRHGRRPMVNIIVPLDVALGRSDLPGELVGYGPIPASLCRDALADPTARLRRLVVGPLGELVDCSTVHDPNQALTDKIIIRDRTCRMIGCNRAACRCEIDHVVPFDGTNTIETNLHGLCCGHHHGKHERGWQVKRAPDGTTQWTSPTGRRYDKPPDPYPINTTLPPPEPEPPDRS